MGQSNVIAGALALAFILFITVRGELPKYLNLFKYKPHQTASTGDSGGGMGLSIPGLGDLKKGADMLNKYSDVFSNFGL